ncbi:BamA/TamA family outer membrane protein [bacterium]|nr:BamA/TamA family outer membrane protein [bacterium]
MRLIGVATILFCGAPHVLAQFSYPQISDDLGFEFVRPVEFYWTPRYNRVEGLFLNFGAKHRPQALSSLQLYGDAGAGFWNESHKQFRFTGGVRKDFFDIKRLSIGAEIFRKLESKDEWIIGDTENSLASLFFGDDFKDYYGAHGIEVYVDHRFQGLHTLRFEAGRRTYDALRRNISWSVFDSDFNSNPIRSDRFIAEGDEIRLRFIGAFDWRDNPIFPLSGWYVEGIYERTLEDFDTDGLFFSVKRYQPTFGNQRLLIRGMLGTRRGDIATGTSDTLASQYSIDIGGVGSLRGFEDKEFSGNRMFMLNANYLFGGDLAQKVPLQNVPFFGSLWSALSFGLFLDTGWAWTVDPSSGMTSGFDELNFDNLQTNVGLSILLLEGVLRMDIAKRTDRSQNDFRVTFRLLEKL